MKSRLLTALDALGLEVSFLSSLFPPKLRGVGIFGIPSSLSDSVRSLGSCRGRQLLPSSLEGPFIARMSRAALEGALYGYSPPWRCPCFGYLAGDSFPNFGMLQDLLPAGSWSSG